MPDNNSNKGFASSNYPQDKAEEARSQGGKTSSSQQDKSKLGQKGGQSAQQSSNAHELTQEERSEGGSHSSGNFKNDPQRASEEAQSRDEE